MALPKPTELMSVKELANQPMLTIPDQFLRLDQDPPINLSQPSIPLPTIPIVDMQKLVEAGEKDEELDKFHSICLEWGFFQLVNHGVSSKLVEKLKHEIEEFYKLNEEEKTAYKARKGDVEGYGKTIIIEENQKIDWGDRFYMVTNPIHRRKAHLLPQLPSSLRETLESYIVESQKLAMSLLGLMAKTLAIDHKEMIGAFEDGMQAMRMTYYPPCPLPESVMGLTPHSDATGITILLQANEVDGLQIKKDGAWIPVNFLPNSFVVNVGDVLEIFSNGLYKSIEHRATVNQMKERISIAMFFNPKFEAEVGPAHSITRRNPNNPPIFKSVVMEQYFKDFFSQKMNGKAFLERMKLSSGDGNTA